MTALIGAASDLPERSRRATRIGLRVAWRNVRRHLGRSILVVALIAIPVAGLAGGAIVIQSTVPTTGERLTYTLGEADAVVHVFSAPDPTLRQDPVVEGSYTTASSSGYCGGYCGPSGGDGGLVDPRTVLSGVEWATLSESSATAETLAGIGSVSVLEGDPGAPMLEGRTRLVAGRAPRTADEVALNAAAMERMGVAIDDEITLTSPTAKSYTVVGQIEDLKRPAAASVVSAIPGAVSGTSIADDLASTSFYERGKPLDWAAVEDLNASGFLVTSRALVDDPPPDSEVDPQLLQYRSWNSGVVGAYAVIIALGAGFSIFEVCLLAGAALLVGTRADLRTFATLASVGADRRVLARAVSGSGLVLGAAGGVVGALLGIGAGWVVERVLDNGDHSQFPGFHISWLGLAAGIAIGMLSGWIASLVAARAATRVDVVSALRGSRRPPAFRHRGWIVGVVLAAAGSLVLASGGVILYFGIGRYGADATAYISSDSSITFAAIVVIVAGAIIVQIGAVFAAPVILRGVAALLRRMSASARIASRDAARTTARSVPTLAAIMSTVFVAAFISVFAASAQEDANASYIWQAEPGQYSGEIQSIDESGGMPLYGLPGEEDAGRVAETVSQTFGVPAHLLHAVMPPSYAVQRLFASADPESAPPVLATAPLVDASQVDIAAGYEWRVDPLNSGTIYVGDASDVAALLGAAAPASAADTLAAGGAVALAAAYRWPDGTAHIETRSFTPSRSGEWNRGDLRDSEKLPAVVIEPAHASYLGIVISAATAERLGLEYGPHRFIAQLGAPPTQAQDDAARAGYAALNQQSDGVLNAFGQYENGPGQFGGLTAWIAIGIASIITIAAAAVAIGLARADARRDDEVLDAVGAPPRLRRGIAFWQAIIVGLLGSAVGALVALLPVLALRIPQWVSTLEGTTLNGAPLSSFAPPWLQLGIGVVVIPLVIALGSWLLLGRRRVAVRRAA